MNTEGRDSANAGGVLHSVLPYPPSVNRYWRHIVFGRSARVLISREGREYRRKVEAALFPCRRIEAARVALRIDAYPPDNRRRDLDNILKALLDSLVAAGALVDDSQVAVLRVERKEVVPGGKVEVWLSALDRNA